MSTPTFLDLPDELLISILKYISQRDVLTLRSVSSRLRRVTRDRELYASVNIRPDVEGLEFLRWADTHIVEELRVVGSENITNADVRLLECLSVACECQADSLRVFRAVNLSMFTTCQFNEVIANFPHLTTLELTGTDVQICLSEGSHPHVQSFCWNRLRGDDNDIKYIADVFPSLHTLELSPRRPQRVTVRGIVRTLLSLPLVRSLTLREFSQMRLEGLAGKLPPLTHLGLIKNADVNPTALVFSVPTLTSLDLSFSTKLLSENVMEMVAGLPLLEVLNLRGCSLVDDACLEFIATTATCLRELNLDEVPSISYEAYDKLFELPNLTTVSTNACWRLSSTFRGR